MIVYHGTTLEVFNKIKEEGILRAADETTSPYMQCPERETTLGYIYVSTKIGGVNGALDFANRSFRQRMQNDGKKHEMFHAPRELIVIKLEIDEELLEKDEDEENFGYSFDTTSFRYQGNIIITDESAIKRDFDNDKDVYDNYDYYPEGSTDCLDWEKIL